MGPLFFKEIFKEKIWGGQNLARLLSKKLPKDKKIGESWELTDFGNDLSIVAVGEFAGTKLPDLLRKYSREITGREGIKDFGLLFKFLDATETLSVQVHPHKHEAWYILEARPGAKLYLGLKEGTDRKGFTTAIAEGSVERCLASVEPEVGQCYYLPAGLTHALGAGLVVAEIQTSEQITYRVFDWNRGRDIQVQPSLDTINFLARPLQPPPPAQQPQGVKTILDTDSFSIDHAIWPAGKVIDIPPGKLQVWMILSGKAHCQNQGQAMEFGPGQTVLLPACWQGKIKIDSPTCALLTSPGKNLWSWANL